MFHVVLVVGLTLVDHFVLLVWVVVVGLVDFQWTNGLDQEFGRSDHLVMTFVFMESLLSDVSD